MSSKLTQITIALLLSAVVAPSVSATIILSPEEEQAIRTGTPAAVKNFAVDLVNEPNLDTYLGKLGGTEEQLKTKAGVGGATSILEDLGTLAQQANPAGVVTQTVQQAIAANAGADVAVKAKLGVGGGTTNLQDLNAQTDLLEVGATTADAVAHARTAFGATNPVTVGGLVPNITATRTAVIAFLNAQAGPMKNTYAAGGLAVDATPDVTDVPGNTLALMLQVIVTKALA